MQVDLLTVVAQIINFMILVWLLKRFLYHPVISAMDRREQRIAGRLNEARQREQQAGEQIQHYRDKRETLDRERRALIAKAVDEAEQTKRQLLEAARDEVAETRKQWQRQAQQEKDRFLRRLQQQSAGVFQSVARNALAGLANAELEEQIIESFIQRLKSMQEDRRKALAKFTGPVRIITSFDLDSAVRTRLTRTVHEQLNTNAEVEYGESSELLCGIELTAGGQRLGWSLADYLEQLTDRIDKVFAAGRPLE